MITCFGPGDEDDASNNHVMLVEIQRFDRLAEFVEWCESVGAEIHMSHGTYHDIKRRLAGDMSRRPSHLWNDIIQMEPSALLVFKLRWHGVPDFKFNVLF